MIAGRVWLTLALAVAVSTAPAPPPATAAEGQLVHERAMFAPIVEPAFLTGVGPRVGEIPTIPGHPYFSPCEDLKLKGR